MAASVGVAVAEHVARGVAGGFAGSGPSSTVADDTPEQRDPGALRPWVRRVGREPVPPVPIRAPGGRVAVDDPGRGWGMVSRRGPFPVPAAAIEEALRDG